MRFYRIIITVSPDKEYISVVSKYAPLEGESWERGSDITDGDRLKVLNELRGLIDYLEKNPDKDPDDWNRRRWAQ